jgi:predicted DNA-binding transcriptional regulator AlpA
MKISKSAAEYRTACLEPVSTAKPILNGARFLKSDDVMRMLGYSDRSAFWCFAKASGLPHIKLNLRRCLFEESAVREWLNEKTIGGRAS